MDLDLELCEWVSIYNVRDGGLVGSHFSYLTRHNEWWCNCDTLCGERIVYTTKWNDFIHIRSQELPDEYCEACYRIYLMRRLSE